MVIHNKTVPLSILEMLFMSPDENLRRDVARKRKLSHELFERLAQDSSESVRLRIAYNAKTPLAALQRLAGDACEAVAETAKKRVAEHEQDKKQWQ